MFPGLSDGERTMLLHNIKENSSDCLPLLWWGFEFYRFHLWLGFLSKVPNCCPKHLQRNGKYIL